MNYDYLIAGAGFAGCVLAERLASILNKKVLLVERRDHIAGNAYDYYDDNGVLIHKYGAHIFHTNHEDVWQYVNKFSQWNNYKHKVLVSVDGKLVTIPINLNTVNTLLNKRFNEAQLIEYFNSVRSVDLEIKNSRDVIVSQVGEYLYELIFKNYTFKHWGVYPEDLMPEVTRRIPVRFNDNEVYFSDIHQGLPVEGYTKLFKRMLENKNITILVNTDFKDAERIFKFKHLIFTGAIDYFFDYIHGRLPYRSLRFEFERHNRQYFQEAAVVNYPNDHVFTRIIEAKHMTQQVCPVTTIAREYPTNEGEPFYPMPMTYAHDIYRKYELEAMKLNGVYFVGRLAEYRYYDMDMVIKRALDVFKVIAGA
ncbi:MAG: UDP-galactopyranose mutase [Nitrospirae bacterium]|nr:UDP-galactopyranose mutase [Nitrospirota bacterium]MBF0541229.1 UDP-galactopyranose mutase [Nitrospirota bacterium]